MMENEYKSEHLGRTRYLKPIEQCNFTGGEMISGLFASLSPALISSVNQLHGDRKGVVRVTCKNMDAVTDLDGKIAGRKVLINGIRLGPVTESGFFVRVTLTDVPEYVGQTDLERELSEYGAVVHSKREFMDYHGYRVENETRHVLFSYLVKEIPPTIKMDGQEVFVTYHRQALKPRSPQTIDEVISHPDNIPRHVIANMREQPTDGLLSRSRAGTPKPGNPMTEMEVQKDEDQPSFSATQSVPNTPNSSKRLPLANSPYPVRRKAPASSVPNIHEATEEETHTRAHGHTQTPMKASTSYGFLTSYPAPPHDGMSTNTRGSQYETSEQGENRAQLGDQVKQVVSRDAQRQSGSRERVSDGGAEMESHL